MSETDACHAPETRHARGAPNSSSSRPQPWIPLVSASFGPHMRDVKPGADKGFGATRDANQL
eukprot:2283796-Rhodomonas_salina.4